MDIMSSIDRFIDKRMYEYALLINGKWGSGKTFFVKKTLIPHIKKTGKPVIYLSLYGIKTTAEISQMLVMQVLKNRVPGLESRPGIIATKVLSSLIKGGMNVSGVGDTGIEGIVELLPDYENNVIFFDDLERCSCSINEVLGYINDFVEHSKASVILVANEEEIGKWQLDRNPEMQMIIAMDSRVKVELPQTMEDFTREALKNGQEKPEKTAFTPDEVEYRRKAIFHSNEEYKSIKEKVIGLTIDYEPELEPIFTAIIKEKKLEGILREKLLTKVEWFISIAERENHNNLRTYQYFLEKISVIFKIIENRYPALHQILIQYTYRSSVRYMKGVKMPKWDGEYGYQEFGGESIFAVDREFGFKFIDDLIVKNSIDATYANKVLDQYAKLAEKKGQLSNDPFRFISEWWTSEDAQVKEWLETIENNIRDEKYSTELYTKLIRCIAELKAHNIMKDRCDSIFRAMKDYIKNAKPEDLDDLSKEHFYLEGETRKLYKSMYEEVDQFLKMAKTESEKHKYEDALADSNHWATNLVKASKSIGSLEGHSFVYWLEPEQIIEKIKRSNNNELFQFCCALQNVYGAHVHYEYMKDDYDHLKAIYDGVKAMDISDWGEVKKVYQVWIVNDIVRLLEKIKPGEE